MADGSGGINRIQISRPQMRFATSTSSFPCFCGGYGSGKTAGLILRGLRLLDKYRGEDIGYYMPTYDLVRRVGFPRWANAFQVYGVRARLNKHDAEFIVGGLGGGRIIFRSMEDPERIVGFETAHSLIDEFDILGTAKAQEVWQKVLGRNRAKLKDGAENTIGVGTTPEGFRFCYETWERNIKPGFELIVAPTSSNRRNLPANYIDTLRAQLPTTKAQAYLDGKFVNMTTGNVYPNFDRRAVHAPAQMQSGEVLHIGMDFNVGKMSAIVSVIRNDWPVTTNEHTSVLDTPSMIVLLKARYQGHDIVVYPDASGNSRKSNNAQESDIALLRQAGFTVRVNPSNPAVKDRVNAVEAIFKNWKCNTDACPVLTEALEKQPWDKNGEPDKTTGHDHPNDAFGYFIAQRWPILRRVAVIETLRI